MIWNKNNLKVLLCYLKIPLQKMEPDLFYGTKIPILNQYTVSTLAFWNQNIGPKIQILVQDRFFVKALIRPQLNWLCPVWPWKMLELTNVEWISRWAKRSPMLSNLSKIIFTQQVTENITQFIDSECNHSIFTKLR